jgi:GH25 family lysozyme M1 (1,4-beta-N-acetylmuramidase)
MASAAAVAVLAATVVGPARPAQAVPIGLCSPTPQTGSGCAQAVDTVQGLDVSNYQNARGTINWTSVKNAGQSFVFIKATEGKTVTDSSYATNDSGTKAAGLLRGAYHFGRPDSSAGDALAEARYFVGVTGTSLSGQLPPVLDLEDDGGLSDAALVTWAKTYLAEVERLTGRVPVIYTGPSFWQTETGNSTEFTRHPLWIAQYTSGTPTVPGGWPNYTFWQNTSSYTVSGITGVVDHDYFHGTLSQLQALADGASVNPYSPTGVCGSGYEIIDQAALADAGTVYLLYNSASGSNCVVTLKQTSLGTASAVSAYLEVEGSTRVTDSGSYGYYAGPVRAAAAGACVKWGGSAGAATYDSAFEHCG